MGVQHVRDICWFDGKQEAQREKGTLGFELLSEGMTFNSAKVSTKNRRKRRSVYLRQVSIIH